jgi:hypothetical protein
MANTLGTLNPEFWSKRMQVLRIDEPVFEAIANMEERSLMRKGDTVHRPYRSSLRVQDYTKGTDITPTDVTGTDEYLTIDQSKVVSFYFDDIDDTQNGYDTASAFADDAGRELYSYVDGEFLAEVLNATQDLDDGDIGGTAGTAISITAANVVKIFTTAKKLLKKKNANMSNLCAVVSPSFMAALLERVEGKDSAFGDSTSKNGNVGTYMGIDLYESNNLPYTARWTPANQPTGGTDSITIDGVVIRFVSTIGTTAGNVLSETDTATTLDNLVAFLNNPSATSAKQVGLTGDDLRKIERITAVDGTTYVGITYNGASEITVAASEVADPWSLQTIHQYIGEKGAADMVLQTAPMVQFKEDPDRLGKLVHTHTLYGIKSFVEGKDVMVDVKINASTL